jgi:thiol-disulfide isomerase/thioredoxin
MKKITIYIVLAMLCLNFAVMAQNSKPPTNLKIGDKVPEITISNILNYKDSTGKPSTSAKISEFKGKLLILDFWATWCTPCIKYLPELQRLQKQFDGKFQVLLVTSQKEKLVGEFLKDHGFNLPSVTGDTLLTQIFKHTYIPHEVWIKDNTVIAVTQPWIVTADNIQGVLTSNETHLPVKNDQLTFDGHQPFLINGNGGDGSNLLYHSVLTKYTDGLAPRSISQRNDKGEIIKLCVTNKGIASLFQEAFVDLDPGLEYDNRLIVNVSDSLKHFFFNEKHTQSLLWLAENGFCYEIILGRRNLYKAMRDDLNHYFDATYKLNASLQKKMVKCIILSRLSGKELIKTNGSIPNAKSTGDEYSLTNLPFRLFLYNIRESNKKDSRPIIDETGITVSVDIHLRGQLNDLVALRNGLKKYGLNITEGERAIDMLVITDQSSLKLTNQSNP